MNSYKVVFYVNNRRTEQIVSAQNSTDAKRFIEAQYAGAQIRFVSVTKV